MHVSLLCVREVWNTDAPATGVPFTVSLDGTLLLRLPLSLLSDAACTTATRGRRTARRRSVLRVRAPASWSRHSVEQSRGEIREFVRKLGREFGLAVFRPSNTAVVRNEDVLKPLQFCYQRDKRPRIGRIDKNKLVIILSARYLPRCPRRVSSKKCRKHCNDTFLREAPQRGRFHAENIGNQLVLCQFEVAYHAGNKIGVI